MAGDRNPLAVAPRDRLYAEIAARVPAESILELHRFAPLRQGGIESGIAVIVARRGLGVEGRGSSEPPVSSEMGLAHDDVSLVAGAPERHAILTASYQLVLKGTERGRWTFELRDEGDAPLEAILRVVRGVQERAGDTEDPERLAGGRFREELAESSPA